MNGNKIVGIATIAGAVALAVVVGNRMSTEAMAVVVGVVCGVAAAIPMSVLILFMTSRMRTQTEDNKRDYPPVIVIQGGQPYQLPQPNQGNISLPVDATLIGSEDVQEF